MPDRKLAERRRKSDSLRKSVPCPFRPIAKPPHSEDI
jgi:hypothetical protein